MITYTEGNLLAADVDALINTVNTVGVMGKGIALQFKRAYPGNFEDYASACRAREVRPGVMHVHELKEGKGPLFIINFPTKRHWRSPSRLEDVEQGLKDLRRVVVDLQIQSIAVPPLGCGNGGLEWDDVHPLIVRALGDLPGVEVMVYPPNGAPDPSAMPNNQLTPDLNRERSAFLVALDRYIRRGLSGGFTMERHATLLEVHKLVFLLQRSGFDLGIQFEKGHYGPYSNKLDNALAVLEGHFLEGYGDGTRGSSAPIALNSDAVRRAREVMKADRSFSAAIERLEALIDGYEHPYGMELLGTMLFASKEIDTVAVHFEEVAAYVREWTPRKRQMFTDAHLLAAWERLTSFSLVPVPAR
ncbi:type II toxin-antitoxin system antitoxin DNA ADP-ribosyl glycohydrolase DarG [Streptomyces sp. LE64]|uniref:type II toxin-antitoxin system antitoxin DNA ADP-ribosyl glycohydrolase DarG n=1 Tax=Streptomyces sp. LE64 TaxID=3448653 RepID=UPI00404184EB